MNHIIEIPLWVALISIYCCFYVAYINIKSLVKGGKVLINNYTKRKKGKTIPLLKKHKVFKAWDKRENRMYNMVVLTSHCDDSLGIEVGDNYSNLHTPKEADIELIEEIK